jgi:hypothetical protein
LAFTGGNVLGSAPVNFATVTGAPTAQIDGTSQAALETVFAVVAPDLSTGVLSGVLADNGGRVQTIALNPDAANPAIDTGTGTLPADTHDLDGDGNTTEALPVDARGLARDVDFDGTPPTPDLGAFEQQNAAELVVTTLDDEAFDNGDLAAEEADGNGLSLREALALANGDPTATDTITFAAALTGGTLFLATGQQLAITTDGITIDGDIDHDGTPDITIDADSAAGLDDAASRVFLISDGDDLSSIAATLNGFFIRDGNAAGAFPANAGGGIYVGQADALTLTNTTVSGNSAGFGGGIFGQIGSSITLANATVSGNSAGFNGGGILGNDGSSIVLTNATVSGNSALFQGGGIIGNDASSITLANATVSGNSAVFYGGGIYSYGSSAVTTLSNSIVAGNAAGSSGDDLFGGPYSSANLVFTGGNVIGSAPANFATTTGAPTAQIDGTSQAALATVFAQVAADPNTGVLSGVLADNGGAVETILILRGGIAQNAGDNAALPADSADLDGDANTAEPLPVDARGLPRVALGTVDLGAVELENAAPVLDATKTPALNTIPEDAGAPGVGSGTSIATLVDLSSPAGGLDNVTDDDAGAATGIALTAVNGTNGTWFYTTDGGLNWNAVGAVSDDAALLLAADADTRLYFEPALNFNGTVADAITFRAWDQSSGTNGDTADPTPAGGSTAFSAVPDTADITVTAVNDAPELGGVDATPAFTENAGPVLLDGSLTLADVDSTLIASASVAIVGGPVFDDLLSADATGTAIAVSYDAFSGILTLSGTDTLANYLVVLQSVTFDTDSEDPTVGGLSPSRLFEYVVTDQEGAPSAADELTLAVNAENDAPFNAVPLRLVAFKDQDRAVTGLGVADPDLGSGNDITVTLQVGQGTLFLRDDVAGGLVAGDISGNGTDTVTVQSSLAGLNETLQAFNGVVYTPDTGFTGDDQLTVTSNDGGNTGSGGALSDVDIVPITVRAAANAGDFNADANSDILWRHVTGTTNIFLMNGATVLTDGNISRQADNSWKIQDEADFNGDGNADILWRNTVDGTSNIFLMNATTVLTDGNISAQLDNNWTVQDTADFNGDGMGDILFRHSDGTARVFLMDGHTVAAELDLTQQLDNNWKFEDTGDFDADGNADIVWRHADGTVKIFFMDGAVVDSSANTSVSVDNTWELV